jgi:hypothetical protein
METTNKIQEQYSSRLSYGHQMTEERKNYKGKSIKQQKEKIYLLYA